MHCTSEKAFCARMCCRHQQRAVQLHGRLCQGATSACQHRLVLHIQLHATNGKSDNTSRGSSTITSQTCPALLFMQRQLANVTHMYVGATAAWLQGVHVQCTHLQVCVQWDNLEQLHAQLSAQQLQPEPIIQQDRGQLAFKVTINDRPVTVLAYLNAVLRMDPARVLVLEPSSGQQYWCESLLTLRRSRAGDTPLVTAVSQRLQQLQGELTAANGQVWSQAEAAGAWSNKLGAPHETAAWILQDPWLRLGQPLFKHLPEQLTGMSLINLMGSHGTKAVAAALLGASVTCVDISPVNAAYGAEVAAAAGVQVQFVVADVLHEPPDVPLGSYDVVLLELGVLHYFIDLAPLAAVIAQLLRPGGRLILREFHPVSTKLISSQGRKHKVTGNYFAQGLVRSSVAYSKYSTAAGGVGGGGSSSSSSGDGVQAGRAGGKRALRAGGGDRSSAFATSSAGVGVDSAGQSVCLRQWGLGEVVTAVAQAGLVVQCLEEEPGVKADDEGIPKLFTLVAVK